MASSVCDPGSQIALMMKLPVASWGCRTRWSDTDPVLLNVRTWQSWEWEKKKKRRLKRSSHTAWTKSHQPYNWKKCRSCCSSLPYLKPTDSQVVLIAWVPSQAEHSERHWGGGQASQGQLPLTGVCLLQQGWELQHGYLSKETNLTKKINKYISWYYWWKRISHGENIKRLRYSPHIGILLCRLAFFFPPWKSSFNSWFFLLKCLVNSLHHSAKHDKKKN